MVALAPMSKHVNVHAVTLVYNVNKTFVSNQVFAVHVINRSLVTFTTHKPDNVKQLSSAVAKAIRTTLAVLTHAITIV